MYTVCTVHMYSTGPYAHYTQWGCQSPNPRKYNVWNGNFVF